MRARLGTTLVPAIELNGAPHAESLDICWLLDRECQSAAGCSQLVPADAELRSEVERLVSFAPRLERAGWGLLGGAWSFSSGTASTAAIREWEAAIATLTDSISARGALFLFL